MTQAGSDEELVIGIDLGTTNTLVAVVESGFPIVLADASGRRLLPSVVHYPRRSEEAGGDSETPLIGEEAQRMRVLAPGRTVASSKRLIGRRRDEIEGAACGDVPLVAGPGGWAFLRLDGDEPGALLSPEAVAAELVGRAREIAERALECSIARAVITVPAYFNHAQREATKRAGEAAGLKVERIVNEPTAAALAYGLDRLEERSKVAVYDFGGGTFDLSILEMHEGTFRVLATKGDTCLGGDDLDDAVVNWILEQTELLPETLGGQDGARILEAAREAKEALSDVESHTVRLPFLGGGAGIELELTRAVFESLVEPLVEATRRCCLAALADASIADPVEALDAVILVGGSTRIPLVRRRVAEIFGREPDTSQHPDEAVALGAAIQAGILCGRVRQVILLDVTPLSLGVETFGGLMNVIIPRNTTIPARAGELFTNAVDRQESMLVRVLQGEREMARDNWELGRIEVPFPSGARGSARVGVQFSIDENGLLSVLARDTVGGTEEVLEISDAAVDVEDEAVEAMISESVEHAFEDMNERVWTEARLKSEELLPAVATGLEEVGEALEAGEREAIDRAVEAVKACLAAAKGDVKALKAANEGLDAATARLATLLVDKAMEEALARRLES